MRTNTAPWLKSVRPGTRQEDARGIDIVLQTTRGTLLIQVKASKQSNARRYLRSGIIVMIAPPETDAQQLAHQFLSIVLQSPVWSLLGVDGATRSDHPAITSELALRGRT